jgi:hypothetical protein
VSSAAAGEFDQPLRRVSNMDRANDALLEEALEQTFPASDPISMQQAVIAGGRNNLPSPPLSNTEDRKMDDV